MTAGSFVVHRAIMVYTILFEIPDLGQLDIYFYEICESTFKVVCHCLKYSTYNTYLAYSCR